MGLFASAMAEGSPAHAGIDRQPAARPGFPRTRGDRPPASECRDCSNEVPPHTRG